MAEELGAVLEAPELETQEVEQVEETPEVIDPAAVVEEKDTTDWRKVPTELKEFFKTPAGKAAKDAWFERNAYKEKFPDGIKQVNELTAFLDEHGGREGLTTALGELQGKALELDDISSKLVNGDPSLISDLREVSPEGFAKLAPIVAEQWAQADPEGWGAAMSGIMAATIQANGIPLFLEKMGMLLEFGKTDDVAKMVGQLKEWSGSFQAKASAPRTQSATKGPDKLNEREQQLNQREEQAFTNDMKRDVDSFRSPLIAKELDSFFKRRPNDNEAKELAISTVRAQVIDRMSNDQKFQDSLNALTARKDKEGAMRLIKSRETAAITEIAPKVGRTIFGNPAAAKVDDKKTTTAVPIRRVAPAATIDPKDAILNRVFGR